MLAPFPPVRPLLGLLRKLGTPEAVRVARLLVQPANAMASQLFEGEAPRVLLLGNAMHADVPPDAPISGAMGFLMTMLAQDYGWPVPVGGSGQLTAALVNRACSAGARIECQSERFSHPGAGRPGGGRDHRGGADGDRAAVRWWPT